MESADSISICLSIVWWFSLIAFFLLTAALSLSIHHFIPLSLVLSTEIISCLQSLSPLEAISESQTFISPVVEWTAHHWQRLISSYILLLKGISHWCGFSFFMLQPLLGKTTDFMSRADTNTYIMWLQSAAIKEGVQTHHVHQRAGNNNYAARWKYALKKSSCVNPEWTFPWIHFLMSQKNQAYSSNSNLFSKPKGDKKN